MVATDRKITDHVEHYWSFCYIGSPEMTLLLNSQSYYMQEQTHTQTKYRESKTQVREKKTKRHTHYGKRVIFIDHLFWHRTHGKYYQYPAQYASSFPISHWTTLQLQEQTYRQRSKPRQQIRTLQVPTYSSMVCHIKEFEHTLTTDIRYRPDEPDLQIITFMLTTPYQVIHLVINSIGLHLSDVC